MHGCYNLLSTTPLAGQSRATSWCSWSGLGDMAVKLATAMGVHVVVFTRSLEKEADIRRLGAEDVVRKG